MSVSVKCCPCVTKVVFSEKPLTNPDTDNIWIPQKKQFLDVYCQNFFWTTSDFISPHQVQILRDWAHTIENEGLLRRAEIGKGALKTRNAEIRSDKIHWLEDFSSTGGTLVRNIFSGLQEMARNELFLPARRFECHFSKYEPGDSYQRHADRHSFLPGRLLTCVLYLSRLQPHQGGELILYDENLRPVKITPEPGRIVVFDSAIEHEVKQTKSTRWSLTGWLREDLHPGLRF